ALPVGFGVGELWGPCPAEGGEGENRLSTVVYRGGGALFAGPSPRRRWRAVSVEDLEFFQMNVDWVLPAAGVVLQDPVLRSVLLHGEADGCAIGELPVDGPLPVITLKAEAAGHARRNNRGKLVEGGIGSRIDTAVGYNSPQPELDSCSALPGPDDVLGSASVVLEQPVFEVQDGRAKLLGNRLEVDDDVIAFSHADAEAGHLHRMRQQIAVIGDDP